MSDQHLESLLRESVDLARSNAVEIRKIRRELRIAGIVRIVVWLIVAGVPVFLYLHLLKTPLQNMFGWHDSGIEQSIRE